MMPLDLAGKRVAVLGMARSGISAAKLARSLGAKVMISDHKPLHELSSAIEQLRGCGVEIETGTHAQVIREPFDVVVLSPGVLPSVEWLQTWASHGAVIWSELELAARAYSGRWIGVTGSNGKTTTVHLITQMLTQAGMRAVMAGNVGSAWSMFLPAPPDTVFVIEVSSFQMEFSASLRPDVAVLLNLYENHLDRHGTMEIYAGLKSRLFCNQMASDHAILNGDDPWCRRIETGIHSPVTHFGWDSQYDFWSASNRLMYRESLNEIAIIERPELPLVGRHNELNALAAAAAAWRFGANMNAIAEALRRAKPVEHRIEFVAEKRGVRFFNDSKSTNMVATLIALDSFPQNVILLFGGRPKKESFAPLARRFPNPVRSLVAFGEATAKVRDELPNSLPIVYAATLADAFARACAIARPGDTVLLSPGGTSFDQFRDYEERGRAFKSLVLNLP